MDQFKVLLQAVLDTKQIGKADITEVQKVLEKYHLNLSADINKAELIKSAKQIVPELEKELKKITGIDIKINDADLLKAVNQVIKSAKQASIAEDKLADSMERVRAKSEQARLAEEKRQVTAQARQQNKVLEEEYLLREKIRAQSDKIQMSLGVGDYSVQIKSYETSLQKLGLDSKEIAQSMSGVKTAFDTLKTSATGNEIIPEQVVANAKMLDKELSKMSNTVKSLKLSDSLNADLLQVDQTTVRLNEQLRKNTAYSKEAKQQIRLWLDELGKGNVAESRLKEINSEAKKLHANMASVGKIGFSLGDKLRNTFEKFGGWSLATGAFMKGVQEFKKGIGFIGELDSAMTDVVYTSDITANGLEKLGNSSIDMAKNLNTSATNTLEAVKIYSTANSTAEDMLRKAKPAIMLSNVSGMSGAESAKTINTAINQFDIKDTEDNLLDIVDTLEYVSSQLNYDFADGMKEITEAVEVSGSVAYNAGLNYQEYATMVAKAVEETGQSGSTIGQSYKTLFSRITKASATEGTLDEDISAAEKSLRSIGVQVRDSEDNFRDLTDIMADLGKVWDSLSSVEKSNIGYNIAGVRQLNVLNSLLGSWSEYESIMLNIDDRTGMTMKNQEAYADSFEGHLGDLSATGQSIWNNVFNSEGLKTGVDTLNGLLKIIESITSALGGLGTAGLIGGSILGANSGLDYRKIRYNANLARFR